MSEMMLETLEGRKINLEIDVEEAKTKISLLVGCGIGSAYKFLENGEKALVKVSEDGEMVIVKGGTIYSPKALLDLIRDVKEKINQVQRMAKGKLKNGGIPSEFYISEEKAEKYKFSI